MCWSTDLGAFPGRSSGTQVAVEFNQASNPRGSRVPSRSQQNETPARGWGSSKGGQQVSFLETSIIVFFVIYSFINDFIGWLIGDYLIHLM